MFQEKSQIFLTECRETIDLVNLNCFNALKAYTLIMNTVYSAIQQMSKYQMSRDMRFLTMWYVRPAKAHISLCIRTVWSELLLFAWISYYCFVTGRTSFGVSKLKRRLHRLVSVHTCQIATLLETLCPLKCVTLVRTGWRTDILISIGSLIKVSKQGHFFLHLYNNQKLIFLVGLVDDFMRLRGGVMFVNEIPRSPSGKILRRNIRKAIGLL